MDDPASKPPKGFYPVNRHASIATFIGNEGMVVGQPVAVGNGIRVPLPDGDTASAPGFNDVTPASNTGSLKVTVETPD